MTAHLAKLSLAGERLRKQLLYHLKSRGVIRTEPEDIELVEEAFESVLAPVHPSQSFRDHLRHNLELAAHHATEGPVVEYPRPFHRGLWLGLSAGVLAAGLTALLLLFRHPRANAER